MNIIHSDLLTGNTDKHITYISDHIGIHSDVISPLQQMQQAALMDGITIDIASGFRSFDRQLQIFNKKFNGLLDVFDCNNQKVDMSVLTDAEKITQILLFSALPGASRHHWGTDIDVYSEVLLQGKKLALEPWEYQADGPLSPLTKWLDNNMSTFGFYRPYDKYRGGIAAEPWHLSYAPLAHTFSKQLTCKVLTAAITDADLAGKEDVQTMLAHIYTQYITNIAES
ncbi:M15 family metallopeptidase [Colwelliaceae bacterium BS250]